ncbi:hypothetical protein [Paenibacillus harenae]|nr:hypothetical protein [Paenibacillus harenae]
MIGAFKEESRKQRRTGSMKMRLTVRRSGRRLRLAVPALFL